MQEKSVRLSPISTQEMWEFALEIILTKDSKVPLWSKAIQMKAIAPIFPYGENSIKNLFSLSNDRVKLPYTKFKNFCNAYENCISLGQSRQDAFRLWKGFIEGEYIRNSLSPSSFVNSDKTFYSSTDEQASTTKDHVKTSLQNWKLMRLQNSRWNFYNHEFQLSYTNPAVLAFGSITSGGSINIEIDFQAYHFMPLWKGSANTTPDGELLIGTTTNVEDDSWAVQISIELGSLDRSLFLSGVISIRTNRINESSIILLIKEKFDDAIKSQKKFLDYLKVSQRQNLSFNENFSLAYSNFIGDIPHSLSDIFGEKTLYTMNFDRKSVANFWCRIWPLHNYECEIQIRTKNPVLLEGYCFPNTETKMLFFNLQELESKRYQKLFYARHEHYEANQSGNDPFDRKERAKFQKDLGSLVLLSPFQANQGIMFGYITAFYNSIFGIRQTSEQSVSIFQSPIILLDKSYSIIDKEIISKYLGCLETQNTDIELEILTSDLSHEIKIYHK